MAFVHVALLGGLALGTIPIIIHILTRRRHKVVRWGAMKYLLAAIEENSRRVQIEDLILLALRVLAICLLALALARPRLAADGASAGGGARLVVLLVDNSPSMTTRRGGSSRLDMAKGWSLELLKRLDRGSAVAVIPMAGPAGASTGLAEPTRELGFASRAISDLAVSGRRANPPAALRAAREALGRSDLAARTVCIVSDFQAADWQNAGPAVAAELRELLKVKDLGVVAVQCSGGERANTAVTALSRAGRIIKVDSPARIAAQLASFEPADGAGGEPPELTAALEVDGARADSRAARLPRGESREVTFYATFAGEGAHAVTLRSAPDICPADDVRHLAVDTREEVRVLCVDGDPHPDEDFLSESFYLRFALSPGAAALSPIVVRTVTPEEFAAEDLAAHDLVVLANVEKVEPTRARDLAAWVRSGRALVLFVGDLVDAESCNRTLLGGPDALLRAPLGAAVSGPPEDGGFKIGTADLAGPVMSFFKGSGGGLEAVRCGKARELSLATAPEAVVQARLAPGEVPFLVTAQVGEGRVAIINSTADATWSNLPLKPAFTALIQRLAVWCLEPRSRCQNLLAGEKYRLSLPLGAVNATLTFRFPDKRTAVVQPVVAGERAAVEFVDTAAPGFYEVTWTGEAGPERRLLAVNIDPAESDLATIEPATLRELAGGAGLGWLDAAAPSEQAKLFARGGREFWRPVLLSMLLILAVETLLGRRFSGGGRR